MIKSRRARGIIVKREREITSLGIGSAITMRGEFCSSLAQTNEKDTKYSKHP